MGGKNNQGMLGIGLDVVRVGRWRRLLRRYGERIISRLFTPEELDQCRGRRAAERLAGRWAAKEAVAKALGCRPGPWRDVVVLRGRDGVPRAVLRGAWERAARERGVRSLRISLSHEEDVAVAVALALAEPGDTRAVKEQ
ncbi:MAG: holo-ACP synthase [Bacillota bacterium]